MDLHVRAEDVAVGGLNLNHNDVNATENPGAAGTGPGGASAGSPASHYTQDHAPVPGERVVLSGLSSQPELNGQL